MWGYLQMKGIYLILGSNLGDKFLSVQKATTIIRKRLGTVDAESSIYETEPWGYSKQPNFLNKVIRLDTHFPPEELLKQLKSIEAELGRTPKERWRERLIDIDILYYSDKVVNAENLVIPHPEIPNRKFVLVPMNELAPDEVHPVNGKTQRQMLEECKDSLIVEKLGRKIVNRLN